MIGSRFASRFANTFIVRDPKLGTVDELFVNAYDEPEYVRIKMGFLSIESVLLPIEIVAVDKQRRTLVLH